MKVIAYDRYGPPNVLQLKEIPRPSPKAGELLIRVAHGPVGALDSFFGADSFFDESQQFGCVGRLFHHGMCCFGFNFVHQCNGTLPEDDNEDFSLFVS